MLLRSFVLAPVTVINNFGFGLFRGTALLDGEPYELLLLTAN